MEFDKFIKLLAKKEVKLVCRDDKSDKWIDWTPDFEDTNFVYLERNQKRTYLDHVAFCQSWRRKGIDLTELCRIRSLLGDIDADKEAIPFVELVLHLISEFIGRKTSDSRVGTIEEN